MNQILQMSHYIVLLATASTMLVACSQSSTPIKNENAKLNSTEKKDPVLVATESPFRFSMYPIYKSESESLVFFHIETLEDKAFISNADVTGDFRAKDGDSQQQRFKLDSKNSRYVATLPLKHHEDYDVKVEVQFPDRKKFFPRFSFHCSDALPELDWLKSEDVGAK